MKRIVVTITGEDSDWVLDLYVHEPTADTLKVMRSIAENTPIVSEIAVEDCPNPRREQLHRRRRK